MKIEYPLYSPRVGIEERVCCTGNQSAAEGGK